MMTVIMRVAALVWTVVAFAPLPRRRPSFPTWPLWLVTALTMCNPSHFVTASWLWVDLTGMMRVHCCVYCRLLCSEWDALCLYVSRGMSPAWRDLHCNFSARNNEWAVDSGRSKACCSSMAVPSPTRLHFLPLYRYSNANVKPDFQPYACNARFQASEWVSEPFLNGTSAHIRLFSALSLFGRFS